MPNYGDEATVTGKAFVAKEVNTIATAIPMPVVAEEDLSKAKHPININRFSGKQTGAMVAVKKSDGSLFIAVARGSAPTDKWDVTAMGAAVTPSAGG